MYFSKGVNVQLPSKSGMEACGAGSAEPEGAMQVPGQLCLHVTLRPLAQFSTSLGHRWISVRHSVWSLLEVCKEHSALEFKCPVSL